MSDINVNFTINQFNAELLVDPAPEVTLNVQDPMTAQFYIEGTTGGPAAPNNSIQFNNGGPFLAGSSNFTYQANANIGWPSLTGNIVSVGNIVVGEVYSGYEAITIKSPSTGNPTTLFIDGSIRPNKSGGSIQIKAGDAYGTGPVDGSAGSLYLYCGVNDLGSGQAGEVWIGGSGTPANVRFIGTGSGFQFTRYGEFFVGGGPGEVGHVLTSQGQFTSPQWLPLGNVSQINFNGNANTVLAGDGNWRAIGNVSSINLNGNGNQVLAGNGSWIAQSGGGNLNNVINAYEAVTLHTTTTGTYNYDILTSSVSYSTANATGNITINFRGNSTTTLASQVSAGKSVTAVYLMTTGSTGYIPSTIQIDGVTRTVRYAANISPIIFAGTVCSYTYTMIKTADSPATWVVLGSQTRYG